ncbi:Tyrosinase ustQ [Cladobotryum mycophilum]|uniref:Tyrosinase ustQ n=1 Tax=Cladobotryum mycophilum TaxID=491253 RepID=A0ABR0SI72_9HYPO
MPDCSEEDQAMRLLSSTTEPKYTAVENSDAESQSSDPPQSPSLWDRLKPFSLYCSAVINIFLFILVAIQLDVPAKRNACTNPPIRKEWRALSAQEQHEFTHAIKCISKAPSSWAPNRTVYDDIAVLHGGIGSWCHRSACFLPWHRHVLSVIETILRDRCDYQGLIPYWDWSIDWMDLANSSIWDSTTGFGGDGDPNSPETVGEGRCVTDGPFSDLRPIIYNHTLVTHCLSRGFRDGDINGRLSGTKFRPENIGDILRQQNYPDFLLRLERDLHNTLHTSINGDFKAMTAANDPLFFLHHVNLDRIWWRWQQENPKARMLEYDGQHMYNSTGPGSLDDVLLYGGFTKDVIVRNAIDTQVPHSLVIVEPLNICSSW